MALTGNQMLWIFNEKNLLSRESENGWLITSGSRSLKIQTSMWSIWEYMGDSTFVFWGYRSVLNLTLNESTAWGSKRRLCMCCYYSLLDRYWPLLTVTDRLLLPCTPLPPLTAEDSSSTPERRKWGTNETAASSASKNTRKWKSMFDVSPGAARTSTAAGAVSRVLSPKPSPRARTPSTDDDARTMSPMRFGNVLSSSYPWWLRQRCQAYHPAPFLCRCAASLLSSSGCVVQCGGTLSLYLLFALFCNFIQCLRCMCVGLL